MEMDNWNFNWQLELGNTVLEHGNGQLELQSTIGTWNFNQSPIFFCTEVVPCVLEICHMFPMVVHTTSPFYVVLKWFQVLICMFPLQSFEVGGMGCSNHGISITFKTLLFHLCHGETYASSSNTPPPPPFVYQHTWSHLCFQNKNALASCKWTEPTTQNIALNHFLW
jgi:hypothetical protein